MKRKIAIAAAILATAAALVGFTNKHETVVTEDSVIIPAETGARVIIQYPDGNVYEFIGLVCIDKMPGKSGRGMSANSKSYKKEETLC